MTVDSGRRVELRALPPATISLFDAPTLLLLTPTTLSRICGEDGIVAVLFLSLSRASSAGSTVCRPSPPLFLLSRPDPLSHLVSWSVQVLFRRIWRGPAVVRVVRRAAVEAGETLGGELTRCPLPLPLVPTDLNLHHQLTTPRLVSSNQGLL